MSRILRYDWDCLLKMKSFLVWLEEWVSISQKKFEQLLIIVYTVAAFWPVDWPSPSGLWEGIVIVLMWSIHREPEAMRESKARIPFMVWFRLMTQVAPIIEIVTFILMRHYHLGFFVATETMNVSFVLFIYSTSVTTKGDPGRRRKLSWAKVKELFGAEWLPEPAPDPS